MLSHEAIILQRGLKDGTATHESLHCLGIPHSFSERNVLFFEIALKETIRTTLWITQICMDIPTIATWNFNGMPFKDLYMLYILENGKNSFY